MTKTKQASGPKSAEASPERANLALGWAMVAVFLALGMVLESFHLVKLPLYLEGHLRRELWTLAHAHGTLFGAINVLFGLSACACIAEPERRARAGRLLRTGSLLLPVGFFLGGVGNSEGDPSLFILLVPAGGLLALIALSLTALAAWRGQK